MRYLKYFAFLGVLLFAAGQRASASFRRHRRRSGRCSQFGSAPVCTYGYYGYYPYACAPYGYYGPDYFVGGIFIGAGPWFYGWGYGHGTATTVVATIGHGYYGWTRPRYYGGGHGYNGHGHRLWPWL